MRHHDPAIADTQECQAIVEMPARHDPISLAGGLPTGWDFWKDYDEAMISACGALLVLQLRGWNSSTGVGAEVEIAKRRGLPVLYAPPRLEELRGVEPELRRAIGTPATKET